MSDTQPLQHRIPVSKAVYSEASKLKMNDVYTSGRLAAGPMVYEFESQWANYLGLNPQKMVAMSSGTAALEAVMHYIGSSGDRPWCAIVSPLGFFSTVSAIVRAGGTPIFADVDESGNLDPVHVKKILNTHTNITAVVVTHWLGQPAQVDALKMLCDEDVFLVEDCAQAHGALLDGKPVGTFGDFAIWSFYATKHITTAGEGGAVYAKHQQAHEFVRRYRSHGMSNADTHDFIGTNARLSEIGAACAIPQIGKLEKDIGERMRVASLYREHLQHVDHVKFHTPEPATRHAYFWMPLRIDRSLMTGKRFKNHLSQDGVEVRCRYSQPFYRQPALFGAHLDGGTLPRAEDLAGQIIGLPYFAGITIEQIDCVCVAVNSVVQDELRARHAAREAVTT